MKSEVNNKNDVDLPLAGGQSWCKTSADLATACSRDNALHTRLKCTARSLSSRDASEIQPMNQLLFSTGKNLCRHTLTTLQHQPHMSLPISKI